MTPIIGYQVAPVLQIGEDHLGAGDVLLGVLQEDIEDVLVPGDANVKETSTASLLILTPTS